MTVDDVTKAAGGSFDILWFDSAAEMSDDTKAIASDVTGNATTLSMGVQRSDIIEGTTKTYYVKVRDHEKNTYVDCYVFDSIKVQSCITPVVPAITIDPICAGSLSDSELEAIVNKFYFAGYTSEVKNQSGTSLSKTALSAEIDSLAQGNYDYTITITDTTTGCVSAEETVTLTVNPSYDMPLDYDTIYLGGTYSQNGWNIITTDSTAGVYQYSRTEQTVLGCDSIINLSLTLTLLACTNPTDIDDNIYSVKKYNNICWMTENLRTSRYADGTDIPVALGYQCDSYPDTINNIAVFGRLYDWQSATRNQTGNNIQGVCPDGWRLPTQQEINDLVNLVASSYDLRSTNYWIDGNGTNLSLFDWRPAGYYNQVTHRFEDLMGNAYMIFYDNTATLQLMKVACCKFNCPDPIIIEIDKNNAVSVRCVKDL